MIIVPNYEDLCSLDNLELAFKKAKKGKSKKQRTKKGIPEKISFKK